ncbi:MAG TPA: TolC family protein [Thermoanaerobaculia bacterium]|nr:TolC family protein [Thermoanaerobaculia bacterium]
MLRAIHNVFWVLLVIAAPAGAQGRLAEAIRRATAENPRLREAQARTEAARRRVSQTAELPDPEIELGLKDVPVREPSLSRDNFTMEMITGRQRLPGRGKRAAQRAVAQADVESAAATQAREAVEIAAETADSFFTLAETDRSLAILEESRGRLEDAAASATELYKVGKAGVSDVLQANLEKTSLDERLSSLRAERRAQVARFNALQGLPATATVPPVGPVEPVSEVPAAGELVRQAAERSPAVAAAEAEVRRAEQALELARLESRPDWMVMGYYGRRERFDDFVGVSAAINLPWTHRRRLDERRAEKEAELAAARTGVETVKNQLQGDVEAAYAELEKNVEQAQLYSKSILPQAEINFRAAREAYVVGKIDFQTLARAANNLDSYRREAAVRASGIGRALAALQKASGLPLLPGTPGAGGSHVDK